MATDVAFFVYFVAHCLYTRAWKAMNSFGTLYCVLHKALCRCFQPRARILFRFFIINTECSHFRSTEFDTF